MESNKESRQNLRPFFIVVDGGDGCGKDTQVDMLSGLGFTMLREPSERIRGDVQQEK